MLTSAPNGTAANTSPFLVPETVAKASRESGCRSDGRSPTGNVAGRRGVAGSKRTPPGRTASTADPSRRNGALSASSSERRDFAGSEGFAEFACC